MKYVRPSFKMGGTPSGIESLVPRVKAKIGFPGFEFLEPGLQNELRTQVKQPSGIGLKKGSRGARFLTQLRPFSIPSLKTIGALAAPFAPTGIMAFLNRAKTDKELDYIRSLNDEFGLSGEAMDPDRIKEIDEERKRLSKEGNEISFADNFKIDIKTAPEYILKAIGTDEAKKELREREQKSEEQELTSERLIKEAKGRQDFQKIVAQAEKDFIKDQEDTKKVPESKDTDPGGDEKEFSFENEFERQVKRVEKYLGKDDVDKGEIAIALSEAVGTPGTLADKAANLNKFLLKKAAGKRKDKRDIAKLAFAAATELEGKMIDAGKLSQREKDRQRYVALARKDNLSEDEKLELKALEGQLRLDSGTFSPSAGITFGAAIDDIKSKLRQFTDKNTSEEDKVVIRDRIKSAITGLNSAGISDNRILAALSDYPTASQFFSEGGRVKKAMGGPTETPAEPVDTKLTFEQLRTRLPKEITDDIVRLVATSEEALQDFAYIRTQGDVEKFNVKYGVNLVLPQNTA